jgi:hypothetical protein
LPRSFVLLFVLPGSFVPLYTRQEAAVRFSHYNLFGAAEVMGHW